jgi:hypothetical protein
LSFQFLELHTARCLELQANLPNKCPLLYQIFRKHLEHEEREEEEDEEEGRGVVYTYPVYLFLPICPGETNEIQIKNQQINFIPTMYTTTFLNLISSYALKR